MPRSPRLHFPGALFLVTSRGAGRQAVFEGEADYQYFLSCLERARERFPFTLHAYALLPRGFELVVEAAEAPLAKVMQAVLTRYASHYNRSRERVGHLFAGRYKAVLAQKETWLAPLQRWVARSPVREGLVAEPGAWTWSGPGVLPSSDDKSPEPRAGAAILGDEAFCESVRQRLGAAPRTRPRPSLEELSARVSRSLSIAPELMAAPGKARPVARARAVLSWLAVCRSRHTHAEVARFLRCTPSAVTRSLRRAPGLLKDPRLEQLVKSDTGAN